MSGIRYDSRPYRTGDATSINELYLKVTGNTRTIAQFNWQWLEAPGGRGEIWLIEALQPNGEWELIGHHGIMPIRFTDGEQDLLFGKTENTMVLPEYRTKILYPRYEKRFAGKYEHRFHALFSTMGPPAAIRQRAAQGYSSNNSWMFLEHGVWPVGSLAKVLARRAPQYKLSSIIKNFPSGGARATHIKSYILSSREFKVESNFDEYWDKARHFWGIAPRRNNLDLTWRFWNNPYLNYTGIIFEDHDNILGYAVIDNPHPLHVRLHDLSFLRPDRENIQNVMAELKRILLKKYKCKLVTFYVTEDLLSSELMLELGEYFKPSLVSRLFRNKSQDKNIKMPRKVTELGRTVGLIDSDWAITSIIMEGRS